MADGQPEVPDNDEPPLPEDLPEDDGFEGIEDELLDEGFPEDDQLLDDDLFMDDGLE